MSEDSKFRHVAYGRRADGTLGEMTDEECIAARDSPLNRYLERLLQTFERAKNYEH